MTQPIRYFARVTAGTEELAWLELKRLPTLQGLATERRRLDFSYAGEPRDLLALRSVDDVYIYVGTLPGLDKTRASLELIAQRIARLPLQQAAGICEQVRTIPLRPRYAVTASLLGQRNYSRHDVARAIRDGLQANYDWIYEENASNAKLPDLDLRVLVEGDEAVVGLRLGHAPLHRRSYKVRSLPGSLKAPVACCMGLLASIQPGDTVFDPMCGAGTIAIEAAIGFGARRVLATDMSGETVALASVNVQQARADVRCAVADATRLPFVDGSIDRIVCNLPWGKQVSAGESLTRTYWAALAEFARVLKGGGNAVLLTDQTDVLMQGLEGLAGLQVVKSQQISLYGSHPTMVLLIKLGGQHEVTYQHRAGERR